MPRLLSFAIRPLCHTESKAPEIKGYDSRISPSVEVLGPFVRQDEKIGCRFPFGESKLSSSLNVF